jgi:rare lipoprotein A
MFWKNRFALLLPIALLAACAEKPEPVIVRPPPPPTRKQDWMQGGPGKCKVGGPYQIYGITYLPHMEWKYDKIGTASWYGPGFRGRVTANGDIYNEMGMTAAHPTLQLPSVVAVTNLDNGRSVVVRVNDRGPFLEGRMIDLSRKAARRLGFEKHGTARVRVKVLEESSRLLWRACK